MQMCQSKHFMVRQNIFERCDTERENEGSTCENLNLKIAY